MEKSGSFVPSAAADKATDSLVLSLPVKIALTRLAPFGEYE
jgi:hypothetical protein